MNLGNINPKSYSDLLKLSRDYRDYLASSGLVVSLIAHARNEIQRGDVEGADESLREAYKLVLTNDSRIPETKPFKRYLGGLLRHINRVEKILYKSKQEAQAA
jgi:hypothetical protein